MLPNQNQNTSALDIITPDFKTGYTSGYLAGESVGYARGYQACDDEITTLQREAHRVVMIMAGLDSHADRERRRRVAQVEAARTHASDARAFRDEVAS